MKQEQIERELRERLKAHRTPWGGRGTALPLLTTEVDSLTAALLPWLMETIEEAVAEARMDEGELP